MTNHYTAALNISGHGRTCKHMPYHVRAAIEGLEPLASRALLLRILADLA